jgi:hypothetical protein
LAGRLLHTHDLQPSNIEFTMKRLREQVITQDTLPKRPHPGLVICYSYLWHREAQKKQIEGLKNRPCAVVLSYEKIPQFPDRVVADVVPITHSPTDDSVEIPIAVKRRMGLDNDHSRIITTEVNRFVSLTR